jgi:hypothetical protein
VRLPDTPDRPPRAAHAGPRLLAAALWPLAFPALGALLRPLATAPILDSEPHEPNQQRN